MKPLRQPEQPPRSKLLKINTRPAAAGLSLKVSESAIIARQNTFYPESRCISRIRDN
jgi:hypothetical protein